MHTAQVFLALVLLTFRSFTQGCSTDDDCSLNGLCQENVCQCDPGWFGPDCGRLDLAPVTRGTGYNYTNYKDPSFYNDRGNSSWGGRILQDRHNPKLFHMFIDQFAYGCGLSAWRPTSFVVRAESRTGPQGPYHWAQNVTGQFRHNVDVFWSPADEKYLMWTIGVDVNKGPDCGLDKSISWKNNISVSAASDIRGPWTPFKVLVNGTNPAPWPLWQPENKTSAIALSMEGLSITIGEKWNGDYKLTYVVPWNNSHDSTTWTEDPFIWRDKRNNWHAIVHWMVDIVEKNGTKYPRVGAHMYSRTLDGNWTFKLQEAFNSTITYTDGSTETLNRRERPKLFFSDDGELTPLYMVNGVQRLGTTSLSYTLVQPIGSAWKKYERDLGF